MLTTVRTVGGTHVRISRFSLVVTTVLIFLWALYAFLGVLFSYVAGLTFTLPRAPCTLVSVYTPPGAAQNTRAEVFRVNVAAQCTLNATAHVRCPLTGGDPRCALAAGWTGTCYFEQARNSTQQPCNVVGDVYAPDDPLVTYYSGGVAWSWVATLPTWVILLGVLCGLTVASFVACCCMYAVDRAARARTMQLL